MESDEGNKQGKDSDPLSILRNFFQSFGIRCPIEILNRHDRKLLVFNFYFLPVISVLLYALLYIR